MEQQEGSRHSPLPKEPTTSYHTWTFPLPWFKGQRI